MESEIFQPPSAVQQHQDELSSRNSNRLAEEPLILSQDGTMLEPDPPNSPDQEGYRRRGNHALRLNRSILVAVAGMVLITGTAIALPRLLIAQNRETPAITALPVQTRVVESVQSYTVTRSYTGQVTATRTSEIGFEQSGTLVWVGVDQGNRVLVRGLFQTGDRVVTDGVQRLVPGQQIQG